MAEIKTFPQVIFVYVEDDGDDSYLVASLTKSVALGDEESRIVGTYQFVASEGLSHGDIRTKRLKNRRTS